MEWYPKLYLSDRIRLSPDEIRERIQQGRYPAGYYLITLAMSPRDYLDIRPVSCLKVDYIRASCPKIVGVASGKQAARDLVVRMTEDCLKATGDVQLRAFFDGQE